ncbi:Tyrosine-protein kinase YwqD [invertebrate metagenome]|uniref:Tyrosine-protein kinase YwqD n=1 Tax=invertebrate metagenome TaxID=1711999 RepID=A0A2H9TCD2_9ZZZZ
MIKLPIHYMEIETLYSNTIGKGLRSLAITSAVSNEGTSTVAYAVAARGAADGKKVLLIEMNMVHPYWSEQSQQTYSQWKPTPESMAENTIHDKDSGIHILPAPCRTDVIRFRSVNTMQRIIAHWLVMYDLILFDTSPVNALNRNNIPAEFICSQVSGTLITVLSGSTQKYEVQKALTTLLGNNINVVGFVMNDAYEPSLVDDICHETHKLDSKCPTLMKQIRAFIRRSPFFNIQQ